MNTRERVERAIEKANAKTAAKAHITFNAAVEGLPFGTLRVRRCQEGRADRRRLYELWIDGGVYGTLSPGQIVDVGLPPGRHVVHLQIDWCRSRRVHLVIAADEMLVIVCKPAAGVITAVLNITVFCKRYIKVRVESRAAISP